MRRKLLALLLTAIIAAAMLPAQLLTPTIRSARSRAEGSMERWMRRSTTSRGYAYDHRLLKNSDELDADGERLEEDYAGINGYTWK